MLTIEKKDNGTVEVWQFDYESKHSVRVCTQPDKLASTLPRDVLVMVRKLVNELDRACSFFSFRSNQIQICPASQI
jgi:hypothetical protein